MALSGSVGYVHGDVESLEEFAAALEQLRGGSSADDGSRNSAIALDADQENVEQGLAKLVLSLVELLRQLLEKQALRRMEGGTLTDEEIERLGNTFMKLQERIDELRVVFGLDDEELNIDLGPLGKLVEPR